MMNFISGEEDIFSIIQNGSERDDIGMTLVIGPSWSDMTVLRKEFNESAGNSKLYTVRSQGDGGTYRTALFSEWLIDNKGFRPLKFIPIYLEDLDKDPNPRDTTIVCETFDAVVEHFKLHAKGVSLNNVYWADDPIKLRVGWLIDKGDESVRIEMPIQCFSGEAYKQRSDQQLIDLLLKVRSGEGGRNRLLAWLVGKANGNELA